MTQYEINARKAEVALPGIIASMPPLPCPCCGAESEARIVRSYCDHGVQVRCKKCRIQGLPIFVGYHIFYNGEMDVDITLERAAHDSIDVWNTRLEATA